MKKTIHERIDDEAPKQMYDVATHGKFPRLILFWNFPWWGGTFLFFCP